MLASLFSSFGISFASKEEVSECLFLPDFTTMEIKRVLKNLYRGEKANLCSDVPQRMNTSFKMELNDGVNETKPKVIMDEAEREDETSEGEDQTSKREDEGINDGDNYNKLYKFELDYKNDEIKREPPDFSEDFNDKTYYPGSKSLSDENKNKKKVCKVNVLECDQCDKTFQTEYGLKKHIDMVHKSEEVMSYIEMHGVLYACKLCKKTFEQQKKVKIHIRMTHKIGAVHTCDVCMKTFYYHVQFKRHMAAHDPNVFFTCDKCGRNFSSKHMLQRHDITAHGSEEQKMQLRKFICSICNKALLTKQSLMDHEEAHSEERSHVCSECGKAFRTQSTLRVHVKRIHLGIRPAPKTGEAREEQLECMRKNAINRRAKKRAQNNELLGEEEGR
jgi:uncharacterized C2H2 Zn-finger protein